MLDDSYGLILDKLNKDLSVLFFSVEGQVISFYSGHRRYFKAQTDEVFPLTKFPITADTSSMFKGIYVRHGAKQFTTVISVSSAQRTRIPPIEFLLFIWGKEGS